MRGYFSNEHFAFKGQSTSSIITFLLSMAFFIILQPIIAFLLHLTVPQFSKFSKKKQRDWISRMISTLHAVVFTVVSFYILFIKQDVYEPMVKHKALYNTCSLAFPTLSFSMAYFIVDLYFVAKYFSDTMTIVHHIGAAASAFVITGYELGPVYMLVFGLTEASTPFVNLRVFLLDLGHKDSMLYALNGIAMWLGFLIVRIPMIFYVPYLIFRYSFHSIFVKGTYLMGFIVIFGYTAITVLNIWWFYLITKGLLKVLQHKPTTAKTNEKLKKVQ